MSIESRLWRGLYLLPKRKTTNESQTDRLAVHRLWRIWCLCWYPGLVGLPIMLALVQHRSRTHRRLCLPSRPLPAVQDRMGQTCSSRRTEPHRRRLRHRHSGLRKLPANGNAALPQLLALHR